MMTSYRICALFLLFNIQSFSSTLVKTLVTRRFPDGLPVYIGDDDAWHAYELGSQKIEDMMVMDAAEETTRMCIPKIRCGFQPFDDEETLRLDLDHSHPFVSYCKCPEGEECKAAGVNSDAHYIYCKCSPQDKISTTEGQDETTTASVESVNLEATTKPQTEMTPSSMETDSEGTVKPRTEMPTSSIQTDSEGTVKPQTEMPTSSIRTDSEGTVKPQTEMPTSSIRTDSESTVKPQTEMPTSSMKTDSEATAELQTEIPTSSIQTDSEATVEPKTEILTSSMQTDSEATVKPQTEVHTPSMQTYSDRVEGMENPETITISQADSTSRYGFIANRNEL